MRIKIYKSNKQSRDHLEWHHLVTDSELVNQKYTSKNLHQRIFTTLNFIDTYVVYTVFVL